MIENKYLMGAKIMYKPIFRGYDNLTPGCCCAHTWKKCRDNHVAATLEKIESMKREEFKPFVQIEFEVAEQDRKLGYRVGLGALISMVSFTAIGIYFQ